MQLSCLVCTQTVEAGVPLVQVYCLVYKKNPGSPGFFDVNNQIFTLIFGFLLNYTAGIVFTYTNTIGTFYISNWVDLLYVTAFLCLGIGVNSFDQKIITTTVKLYGNLNKHFQSNIDSYY
jgi:hypothetical protein